MDKLYEIRKKVSDYIKLNSMISPKDTIVAGVSGGADSMCLLNLLLDMRDEYEIRIIAVHIHHGIRGAEADEDMQFTEDFCKKHNVEFYGERFDIPTFAKEKHLSSEEAGRLKRYETFNRVLNQCNNTSYGKIAVAHNMDDNTETFLFNLFRGTGLTGLTGIRPVRGNIIRPVLCLSREEILAYLKEKNVTYRTDCTNEQTEYTRNKIRLKLLPYIKENINEGAKANINRTAVMLGQMADYMERQAEEMYKKYVKENEKGCLLGTGLWEQDKVIVSMVIRKAIEKTAGRLKDITSLHIESIVGLGNNTVSKSVDIPYGIKAQKTYDGVNLFKENKNYEQIYEQDINFKLEDILNNEGMVETYKGKVSFVIEKNKCIDLREKIYTKLMDYDILNGDLSIRNRKAGDYMIIGNAGQKKKLKDLLIDLKIPREQRDSLLLLAKGQEILWIIGYRMSERCKITEETTKILKVHMNGEKE